MSSIRCLLYGQHSNYMRNSVSIANHRHAFIHISKALFLKDISKNAIETDYYRLCGPSVKKLLTDYGINFSEISSTGPHNNILKGDVLNYIRQKNLQLAPIVSKTTTVSKPSDIKVIKTKTHIDIPVTNSRRNVAKQLIYSKVTIPHAYMNVDCNIDKVFEYKQRMDLNVTLDDFLIKSAAIALRKVPEINIMNLNGQIKGLNSINITITVPSKGRFVSPTIKNADNLTIELISEQMNKFCKNANEWKLDDEKFSGGSFRISNLGTFGVSEFSSIIYPPEVAILSVGSVRLVLENEVKARKLKATLSFNNEIINENEAGLFLNIFKQSLEDPLTLCLS